MSWGSSDWANYGGLLKAFSDKYDIEVNNDTSTGASQDLINAVKNRQGQEGPLRLPRHR